MNYVFSLFDHRFTGFTESLSPTEIIVYPYRFSKYGKILPEALLACIQSLKAAGHRVAICADVMLKEAYISEFKAFLMHPAFQSIDAFRFLDPGVGNLFRQTYPNIPIQQSLERHSLNLNAVQRWCDTFEPSPERIILSSQLPLENIREYQFKECPEFELMGIGLIDMFYSARNLLDSDQSAFFEEREIKNTERPGALTSKIIQTAAGTVMFYERMLYIADLVSDIEKAGVRYLRFDFWDEHRWKLYLSLRQSDNSPDNSQKDLWGKTTRAFIKANKTQAQFKRLTNENLRKLPNKHGRVLEYSKSSHLAVEVFEDITLPAVIQFITPEGKDLETVWHTLKNIHGDPVQNITPGIYVAPQLKYALNSSYFRAVERVI